MTNQYAKRILEALIKGTHLSEQNAYSALQNEDVKGALNYALGAIDATQKIKVPFSLSKEEKAQIKIDPDEYLGVSRIASRISEVLPPDGPTITGSQINRWLTQEGILEDDFHDGKKDHKITEYGKQCGAQSSFVEHGYGNRSYWYNAYPADIVS